ncbi:MAG: class I SAM-dependent methyltransferase [Acidimicrobiales bacterium]|nr:MAG: class I SAM-dependent methyltransferase [Acidimicrobiales bacterium]
MPFDHLLPGDHDAASYGIRIADDYDAIYDGLFDTEGAVARLAELAGDGPITELGVGTGRVAIPLSERGFEVHGIDGSAGMLELLAAKPGGDRIHLKCCDFADVRLAEDCSLVFLLVNTIYALANQEAQIHCFSNIASQLAPGGRFVVEAWVPDPPRAGEQRVRPRRLAAGLTGLVIEEHDPVAQTLATTQVVLADGAKVKTFPVVHRYAWPSELDLMARLAGLSLEHRWSDWQRRPFDTRSSDHVSVWRKE